MDKIEFRCRHIKQYNMKSFKDAQQQCEEGLYEIIDDDIEHIPMLMWVRCVVSMAACAYVIISICFIDP